jgi:hypothetical protein
MTSAQLVAFRDDIDTDGDFRISLAEFEEGLRLRMEGVLESPVALRNRARLADAAWVQVHTGVGPFACQSPGKPFRRFLGFASCSAPAYTALARILRVPWRFHRRSRDVWFSKVIAAAAKDPITWARALPKIFADLDLDHNGTIDSDELAKALPALNVILSPPELAAFAKSIDANGNGLITFDEFNAAVNLRLPAKAPQEAKAVKAAAREAKAQVDQAQRAAKEAVKRKTGPAPKPASGPVASDVKHAWAAVLEAATADPAGFDASVDALFAKLKTDGSGEVSACVGVGVYRTSLVQSPVTSLVRRQTRCMLPLLGVGQFPCSCACPIPFLPTSFAPHFRPISRL